jgi:Tol biopolymer transport system component
MAPDGSGQTRLTNETADFVPDWSPDGTRIAFMRSIDGAADIFVMRADGTGQANLTNHPAADRFPNWGRGAGPLREVID